MTIVWACVIGLLLPDNPVKAKFVSEREKAIVIDKIRGDQTGVENKTFKKDQMIEAFLDPKTWLMFFLHIFISIPNGGLTNFAPLIIKGLGYTSQRATLLTMPTGIMQTVASYMCNGGVFLCAKYFPTKQLRTAWVMFGILVGMIAAVFLYVLPTDNFNGRLAALYCSYFYLGPYIVALGINTANTAGHTKKVTVNALIFIAYCVSNIIAPQFFKSSQAPLYPLGMGAILASYVLSMITMALYAAYCWNENRRRDAIDVHKDVRIHADTDFRDVSMTCVYFASEIKTDPSVVDRQTECALQICVVDIYGQGVTVCELSLRSLSNLRQCDLLLIIICQLRDVRVVMVSLLISNCSYMHLCITGTMHEHNIAPKRRPKVADHLKILIQVASKAR